MVQNGRSKALRAWKQIVTLIVYVRVGCCLFSLRARLPTTWRSVAGIRFADATTYEAISNDDFQQGK